MMARNKTAVLTSVFVALTASAAPAALAQEAIMLETIGAVRMVSPQELQRRGADDATRRQQQAQPASLPRRHAEITQ